MCALNSVSHFVLEKIFNHVKALSLQSDFRKEFGLGLLGRKIGGKEKCISQHFSFCLSSF